MNVDSITLSADEAKHLCGILDKAGDEIRRLAEAAGEDTDGLADAIDEQLQAIEVALS